MASRVNAQSIYEGFKHALFKGSGPAWGIQGNFSAVSRLSISLGKDKLAVVWLELEENWEKHYG